MRDRDALNGIREELGISYEELGHRVGKTRGCVCEQLKQRGSTTMSLALLVEYADALGYSVVLMKKSDAEGQRFVLDEHNNKLRVNRYRKRRESLLAELERINRELGEEK